MPVLPADSARPDLHRILTVVESRLPDRTEWKNLISEAAATAREQSSPSIGWPAAVALLGVLAAVAALLWMLRDKPKKPYWLLIATALVALLPHISTAAKDVIVAYGAWRSSQPGTSGVGSKELVYLSRASEHRGAPIEYFPFIFDLASGPSDWAKGTTLSSHQIEDLRKLVSSLQACVGSLRNQDVEVEIRGYADSNEFPSHTDEYNRQAANRRATTVHRHVKSFLVASGGPSTLVLRDPVEWPASDPSAMTRSRYYSAKSLRDTGNTKDQGLFNRRADIVLLRAGVCERLVVR